MVGALALVGCGDDKSPGIDGEQVRMPDLEQATEALAPIVKAYCERAFRCCSDGELALELGAAIEDAAGCEQAVLSSSTAWYAGRNTIPALSALQYVGYDFSEGNVTIDDDAVKACAKEVEDEACREDEPQVCKPGKPETESPCDDIFVGMRAEGEECGAGQNFECEEGLYCQSVGGNRSVCMPRIAQGEPCNLGGVCEEGLLCDPQRDICVKGLAAGETCAFVDPEDPQPGTEKRACAPGLACDTEKRVCTDADCHAGMFCNERRPVCPEGLQCVYGQCGELREDGKPCWEDEDCKSGLCDYDPLEGDSVCGGGGLGVGSPCRWEDECASRVCDYDTETCRAPLKLGESCSGYGSMACEQGICAYDAMQGDSFCIDGGKDGAACGNDNACARRQQFECVVDACRKTPLADGATCETADQCESEQCVEGECTPLGEMGDDCDPNGSLRCADDFYCAPRMDGSARCVALKPDGEACDKDRECENNRCQITAGMKLCGNGQSLRCSSLP